MIVSLFFPCVLHVPHVSFSLILSLKHRLHKSVFMNLFFSSFPHACGHLLPVWPMRLFCRFILKQLPCDLSPEADNMFHAHANKVHYNLVSRRFRFRVECLLRKLQLSVCLSFHPFLSAGTCKTSRVFKQIIITFYFRKFNGS